MRVTVSMGGPFPAPFRWAEYLEKYGCLERMLTFMPKYRLRSHLQVTLRDEHLLSFSWLGYVNYLGTRLPFAAFRRSATFAIADTFDRLAADHVGSCDVFNGWSFVALHSMRAARSRGARVVLNTGSTHVVYLRALLEREFRRYGYQGPVIDPRLVARGIQEFAEADHVIVPSAVVCQSLIREGVPSNKISIIPEALTRRFPAEPKRDSAFRIIAVGRLELRKGVQYLLEAVTRLRLPATELVLVGAVQEEFVPILRRYPGACRLTGPVRHADLGRIYSQASVLVVPSVEDGWGHVTLEGLSCGLPAIVSANAGSADLIRDGDNGFVVPACDPDAIMARLAFLHANPAILSEMGHRARASAASRTWEAYGRQTASLYGALVPHLIPSESPPHPTDH